MLSIHSFRKLELFGHICRMGTDRKIKSVVFGRLDGTNKRGRPHKEWMDNITDWCGASIQELYHAALEKQKWRRIMRTASGTYKCTGIGPLVNDDDDYGHFCSALFQMFYAVFFYCLFFCSVWFYFILFLAVRQQRVISLSKNEVLGMLLLQRHPLPSSIEWTHKK